MAASGKFACKTIGDSAHSEPAEPRDAGVISKLIDKDLDTKGAEMVSMLDDRIFTIRGGV